MRTFLSILIGSIFLCSCQGQTKSTLEWKDYLQPLEDQISNMAQTNDSLFQTLNLVKNNPLHDKILKFRKLRIEQHEYIDSLKKLMRTESKADYLEGIKESRRLLLENSNFEQLKTGEERLVMTARSIPELKENSAVSVLQKFKNQNKDQLQKNSIYQDSDTYHLLFAAQLHYLSFENTLIELTPRFDKRRKGTGHPEHDTLQVSKYNCSYKTFKDHITIGDHRNKVVDILGQPQRVMNYHKQDTTNYYLYYKTDHILMHKDTVAGWDNRDNALKVKLETDIEVNSIKYITIGSSKCEVLALLGTPNELDKIIVDNSDKLYNCHEKWGYGEASDYLCFSYKDEVMEYGNRNKSFDIKLNYSKKDSEYFSIGSTKEEVAALNGSPCELTTIKSDQKESWLYLKGSKHGLVDFKNGIVISVDNSGNLLKFKY